RVIAGHAGAVALVGDVPRQRGLVAVLALAVEGHVAAAAVGAAAAGDDLAAVVDPTVVAAMHAVAVDEHSDVVDRILCVLPGGEDAGGPGPTVIARAAARAASAARSVDGAVGLDDHRAAQTVVSGPGEDIDQAAAAAGPARVGRGAAARGDAAVQRGVPVDG